MKILVLNGPNLQLLGTREPEVYGADTLSDIESALRGKARELEVAIEFRQSNHEGELVSMIAESTKGFDGILFNPAAYTHTSVAILDALRAVDTPCVEIHLSNTSAREEFRQKSITVAACIGQVMGFGKESYTLGLQGLVDHIKTYREGGPDNGN